MSQHVDSILSQMNLVQTLTLFIQVSLEYFPLIYYLVSQMIFRPERLNGNWSYWRDTNRIKSKTL
jgi:hypothetical protein